MSRIVILSDHEQDRLLLAEHMAARHEVILPDPPRVPDEQFDLCIIDRRSLERHWDTVVSRRETERPVHLPFLLVSNRRDLAMNTSRVWEAVDFVVTAPIRKAELQASVESLLRTRKLSVDLGLNQRELARSNADLQQFAYVASHDLKEPLRMVASYVELLARRYRGRLDADADDFIGFAVEGVRRMQALIDDLLQYSRVSMSGKPLGPVPLGEALDAAIQNLRPAIDESGADVGSDALPTVRGDETQLVQLLQNLIGNAIKFRREEPPRVYVSAAKRDSEWVISVRDNGIGIAPEHHDRIFQIYERLHSQEEYTGTGLGLTVCKRIVERYGGRIWLESVPGKGSTFFFTMPVVEQDG